MKCKELHLQISLWNHFNYLSLKWILRLLIPNEAAPVFRQSLNNVSTLHTDHFQKAVQGGKAAPHKVSRSNVALLCVFSSFSNVVLSINDLASTLWFTVLGV